MPDYETQLETARWKKAQLERELERLGAEKIVVTEIKRQVKQHWNDSSVKNSASKFCQSWQGKNYDDYVQQLQYDVNNQFRSYHSDVDVVLDAICDAITQRENELNDQIFLIGWLVSAINSAGNEIEKTFN